MGVVGGSGKVGEEGAGAPAEPEGEAGAGVGAGAGAGAGARGEVAPGARRVGGEEEEERSVPQDWEEEEEEREAEAALRSQWERTQGWRRPCWVLAASCLLFCCLVFQVWDTPWAASKEASNGAAPVEGAGGAVAGGTWRGT